MKEPWQMTRAEYLVGQKLSIQQMQGLSDEMRVALLRSEEAAHLDSVKRAVRWGEPVPAEVLKDYLDLAKTVPPAEVSLVPSISVQTGLPGIGKEAAQVKAFEEWGTASGAGGHKDTLIDVEAIKRREESEPLPGQITMLSV